MGRTAKRATDAEPPGGRIPGVRDIHQPTLNLCGRHDGFQVFCENGIDNGPYAVTIEDVSEYHST